MKLPTFAYSRLHPFGIIFGVFLGFLSACTTAEPSVDVDKDEYRSAAANGKADGWGDFCEDFGWYGDMECDDFCPSPDPDCAICRLPGEACDESECGSRPEFSPRPCPDGTFIWGSASCVDMGGTCGWEFEAPECPALEEGALCEESFCGDARPELSPRPCHDGSFVFGSTECRADAMGECGWQIDGGECPACDESACGSRPELSPRPCPDGTFIWGSVSCVDASGTCEWDFEAPECPALEEGALCEESFCGDARPELSPRPCHDGSFVFGSTECRADVMGECGWQIDGGECPTCDDSACGSRPEFSPRPCHDGTYVYGSAECVDSSGTCEWDFDAPECPAMVPGTPCDPSFCGEEPSFTARACCDGTTVAPPTSCEVDATGAYCEWVVGTAVCG